MAIQTIVDGSEVLGWALVGMSALPNTRVIAFRPMRYQSIHLYVVNLKTIIIYQMSMPFNNNNNKNKYLC